MLICSEYEPHGCVESQRLCPAWLLLPQLSALTSSKYAFKLSHGYRSTCTDVPRLLQLSSHCETGACGQQTGHTTTTTEYLPDGQADG